MPTYDSSYGTSGRTLADLIQRRGDQQAAMHLQRGDIAANMWGQAGQTISNAVSGWQRNVAENRQREIDAARESRRAEAEGIQIEGAKMQLAGAKRKEKGEAFTRAVLPLARREDGLATYDRNIITREFESAGMSDQLPDVLSKLDEQDQAHMKVLQARRDAVGMDAFRVLQSGGDENTYAGLLQYWEENDALPTRELKAMKELGKDPQKRQQALMAAVQSSPAALDAAKKLQEMNAPKLTNVAPGASVIDARNPEAGALFTAPQEPKTPTNIEDAILRASQAGNQAEVDRLVGIKKEIAAAGRAPASAEPLQSIMGPDGQSVLVPRSQAIGQHPASTREVGRQVTSGDAGDISGFNTALDDVGALRAALAGNESTGTAARIGAALPNAVTEYTGWGSDAKKKQAVIARVKQVIGKALEGGVLRKEDETKYADILPTIGDPADVVTSKIDGLEKAIQKRQQRKLDALQDAGYDTSRYQQRGGGHPATGPVRMTAPDGRELMVPADKVDEAKRRGAKVAG